MPRTWLERIEYWSRKIEENGERSFGRGASNSAVRAFRNLAKRPNCSVLKAPSPSALSKMLGVHRKYTSRVLALLTGSGLVTVDDWCPVRIGFHREHVLRHKNPAQKERSRIPRKLRNRLLREDHYKCGHCCEKFPNNTKRLEIDHIVPRRWRGADEPGNWLALCSQCNREKWHNLESGFIKLYRGKRVKGSVGVRLKGGFLYPHINGKPCTTTREDWKKFLG